MLTANVDFEKWMRVAASGTTIIAAGVAVYGINAWRREHVGKRRAELAEETLVGFYQAADAIRWMRNPSGIRGEGKVDPLPGESPQKTSAREDANVLFVRYNRQAEAFNRLRAAQYRFRTLFGEEASKPFTELSDLLHELFIAARMLAILWGQRNEGVSEQREPLLVAEIERYEPIFWWSGEDDPINRRLDEIVKSAERQCRPAIVARDRLSGFRALVERGAKAIEEAQRS